MTERALSGRPVWRISTSPGYPAQGRESILQKRCLWKAKIDRKPILYANKWGISKRYYTIEVLPMAPHKENPFADANEKRAAEGAWREEIKEGIKKKTKERPHDLYGIYDEIDKTRIRREQPYRKKITSLGTLASPLYPENSKGIDKRLASAYHKTQEDEPMLPDRRTTNTMPLEKQPIEQKNVSVEKEGIFVTVARDGKEETYRIAPLQRERGSDRGFLAYKEDGSRTVLTYEELERDTPSLFNMLLEEQKKPKEDRRVVFDFPPQMRQREHIRVKRKRDDGTMETWRIRSIPLSIPFPERDETELEIGRFENGGAEPVEVSTATVGELKKLNPTLVAEIQTNVRASMKKKHAIQNASEEDKEDVIAYRTKIALTPEAKEMRRKEEAKEDLGDLPSILTIKNVTYRFLRKDEATGKLVYQGGAGTKAKFTVKVTPEEVRAYAPVPKKTPAPDTKKISPKVEKKELLGREIEVLKRKSTALAEDINEIEAKLKEFQENEKKDASLPPEKEAVTLESTREETSSPVDKAKEETTETEQALPENNYPSKGSVSERASWIASSTTFENILKKDPKAFVEEFEKKRKKFLDALAKKSDLRENDVRQFLKENGLQADLAKNGLSAGFEVVAKRFGLSSEEIKSITFVEKGDTKKETENDTKETRSEESTEALEKKDVTETDNYPEREGDPVKKYNWIISHTKYTNRGHKLSANDVIKYYEAEREKWVTGLREAAGDETKIRKVMIRLGENEGHIERTGFAKALKQALKEHGILEEELQ